jgi:outer membrane protein assembly factor BamB
MRPLLHLIRLAACPILVVGAAFGGDWPMWRYDARRSAASPEELPATLHLQWVRQYPPPTPAWPDQPRLWFDVAYEPVVAGKTLFFGSPANDSVTALDADTGAEKWRFHADGPIRFAPAAWGGRLYFVSDDGHLYCLDAATGALRWKFRGGPPGRNVLGNSRLVSLWVARGAPVVEDGTVYFGAGIWPFEGVFLHALDAETGKVLWTNDSSGAMYFLQPHWSPAFSGVAPQGYLAIAGDKLLVPCGRSVPAGFDRATGKFLYYRLAENQRSGGFLVTAGADCFVNGRTVYDLADGESLARVGSASVVTDEVIYSSDENGTTLTAYDATRKRSAADDETTSGYTSYGVRWLSYVRPLPKLWSLGVRGKVHLRAGPRLYVGGKQIVQAIDLPQQGRKPQVSWEARMAGTPASMLAADGKLFVATLEGHIYCFGGSPTAATMPDTAADVLIPWDAAWKCLTDGSDPGGAWRTAKFDGRRWASGPPVQDDEAEEAAALESRWRPKERVITAYYRRTFQVAPGARYKALNLELRVADGAVVYLNGIEVFRVRMPAGPVGHRTLALEAPYDTAPGQAEIDPAALAAGDNLLAVEVHRASPFGLGSRFGLELTATKATGEAKTAATAPQEDEWTQQAKDILSRTSVTEGYCLLLGLGAGRLAEELARLSRLHVVALDPDAERVQAVRKRLDAAGLYGTRVAAHAADPLSFPLPPYFASLIVSEDLDAAGSQAGRKLAEKVFHSLRPYGGVACLPISTEEHDAFSQRVLEAGLENAAVERSGGFTLLRRVGALPGSGEWTHQNCDAANTCLSKDTRVRAPLGILWFGGPTHEKVLPRHGHGPTEQVVGGRLFIEGPNHIQARDVYTGRVLWEAALPGVGDPYDNTSHQPGANAVGSNFVSVHDGVYVAYGETCLRLSPATGERLAELAFPRIGGADGPSAWGFITVWEDILLAGTSPLAFDTDADFTPEEFAGKRDAEIYDALNALATVKDFRLRPRRHREKDVTYLASNLNDLLALPSLADRLPRSQPESSRAAAIREAIRTYLMSKREPIAGNREPVASNGRPAGTDRELKKLNRMLIEETFPRLPRRRVLSGAANIHSGTASKWLIAMNRYNGRVLWTREATHGFLHNAIVVGDGKVFCIDRVPEGIARRWSRRGTVPDATFELLALDARNGEAVWRTTENVFGTWLAYSEEYDILVQAVRYSRDMLYEPSPRMSAYSGTDGTLLWDAKLRYSGPCMLRGDTIITQEAAFSLLSGDERFRRHPLTDEEVPWEFTRNYGCGTAIASQNLLTFRSAAAGYFDLTNNGGTANLGGFRSGCTSNLIVADGVLNAPDYTRTCTCSYQNQASLALIHAPDAETWTFHELERSDEPVKRVGINLGAPGDRLADNGVLWLDYPSVGGPSPDLSVRTKPENPEWFCHHSSWAQGESLGVRALARLFVQRGYGLKAALQTGVGANLVFAQPGGDGLRWVAASGAKGIESVSIILSPELKRWHRERPTLLSRWLTLSTRPHAPSRLYTVRLHFVEPDDTKPGERVFGVSLQGEQVIERLDVAEEAGGPRRPLVKEFRGVEVADDLRVSLTATDDAASKPPVLCGIELLSEAW